MLRLIGDNIWQGYKKTFNYSGREPRSSYLIFVFFQIIWFSVYLSLYAVNVKEIYLIPLILFLLPLLACVARRINDAGYSKLVFFLFLVAPYIMVIFLLFPSSKEQQS